MPSLRHSGVRLAGALLLAVLVFVPLVESGHSHANRDLTRPCSTCLVAHHSPAAVAPTIALTVIPTAAVDPARAPIPCPARGTRSPRLGRAPPIASSVVSV